jgi:hypothetical protein
MIPNSIQHEKEGMGGAIKPGRLGEAAAAQEAAPCPTGAHRRGPYPNIAMGVADEQGEHGSVQGGRSWSIPWTAAPSPAGCRPPPAGKFAFSRSRPGTLLVPF